jgi:hypothetical protein
LRRHGYRLEPMTVGLPTSTPAFQMAAMYGVRPDIQGFHYYSREWQSDSTFRGAGMRRWSKPNKRMAGAGSWRAAAPTDASLREARTRTFLPFASLTRPSGRGLLAALSPFVVLGWVCLKSLLRTMIELVRAMPRLVDPVKGRQGWRWFTIKIGISVWRREFFTMAVSRDLYAGTPAVYVNYLDYDEAGHNFGPRSRPALVNLRRVDRAIRQLWRVTRRVPEHQYDLYILSDHGQARCTPYRDLNGGQRFERWISRSFWTPSRGPHRTGAPDRVSCAGLVPAGVRPPGSSSTSLTIWTRSSCGAVTLRRTNGTASE